jgi:hypothetical protein
MNHAIYLLETHLRHQDKKIKYCSIGLLSNNDYYLKMRLDAEDKKMQFQDAIDLIKKNNYKNI